MSVERPLEGAGVRVPQPEGAVVGAAADPPTIVSVKSDSTDFFSNCA